MIIHYTEGSWKDRKLMKSLRACTFDGVGRSLDELINRTYVIKNNFEEIMKKATNFGSSEWGKKQRRLRCCFGLHWEE